MFADNFSVISIFLSPTAECVKCKISGKQIVTFVTLNTCLRSVIQDSSAQLLQVYVGISFVPYCGVMYLELSFVLQLCALNFGNEKFYFLCKICEDHALQSACVQYNKMIFCWSQRGNYNTAHLRVDIINVLVKVLVSMCYAFRPSTLSL